jgi:hypothetical protein
MKTQQYIYFKDLLRFSTEPGYRQAGHKKEKTLIYILFIVVSLMIIMFGRNM